MNRIYSYHDYEEAYYHMQYYKLREIGCYLLSFIHNDRARELSEKLSKVEWRWDLSEEEHKYLAQLYLDVKLWIMVYENY